MACYKACTHMCILSVNKQRIRQGVFYHLDCAIYYCCYPTSKSKCGPIRATVLLSTGWQIQSIHLWYLIPIKSKVIQMHTMKVH